MIDGVSSTPKAQSKSRPRASVKAPLSPRGRGSVAVAAEPDRLLSLFAQNMRLVRKSQDLSQEALADVCDLDRTYISGIERQLRNVSIRNIQRIADALAVDARVLLDPQLATNPKYQSGQNR